MALNSRIKVRLPEDIIIRRNGKYPYVYKVLEAFRNEKGQPDNRRKNIGKYDEQSGMLIPNDAYYEYCGEPTFAEGGTQASMDPGLDRVQSVGASFIVGRALETLGISDILGDTFGAARAAAILAASAHMACRGNVFEHVGSWCEEFTLGSHQLTSQSASALFASITHGERMSFFRSWVEAQQINEYLAYDVTSFSSYATGIMDAEWGYNRDKERLPQISLGCYLGQRNRLPAFYVTYPGSINDKSRFAHMMAYNDTLGVRHVCFVMDRGFCMAANMKGMHRDGLSYVIGTDTGAKDVRAAIKSVRDGIESMRNHARPGIYARAVRSRFYGVETTLHIYFDSFDVAREREELYRSVEMEEEALGRLEQLTKKEAKGYSGHFNIQLAADGTFSFQRDYGKIDSAAMDCGFFCLMSNKVADSGEALDIYRRKDVIEKGFDDIKNHVDMKGMRAHLTETTDGKLFCAFIALIAISHIANGLSGIKRKKPVGKPEMIMELEKIKVVYLTDGRRLMNPVTKAQRTILEACGATVGDLMSFIGNGGVHRR